MKKKMKKIFLLLAALIVIMSAFAVSAADMSWKDIMVLNEPEYPTLALDTKTQVTIAEANGSAIYKFVPSTTGAYKFYAESNGQDTYGMLYDSEFMIITSDDDGGEHGDFKIVANLTAGQTYYLGAQFYSGVTGSYYVTASAITETATSVTINTSDSVIGYVGKILTLTANLQPEECVPVTFQWQSSNESIVVTNPSSDNQCYLTCVSAGNATVTVTTSNGLTDTIQVEVREIPEISVGNEMQITTSSQGDTRYVKFIPSVNGTYMFYTSNNCNTIGGILTDSNGFSVGSSSYTSGVIKAIANLEAGKTYYFSMTSETDTTVSFTVYLKQITQVATSVVIEDGDSIVGYVQEEEYLYAELQPEECIPEEFTWTSNNPSVVSVGYSYADYCHVKYHAVGTATITVTSSSGLTDQIVIHVREVPTITAGSSMNYTSEGDVAKFEFTPEQTGTYSFKALHDGYSPYIYLYDVEGEYFGGNSSRLTSDLQAGVTYYYYVQATKGYSFQISLNKVLKISSLEIESYPNKMTYYQGTDNFNLSGLKLKATMEDESTIYWEYYEPYLGDYSVTCQYVYNATTDMNSDVMITCGGKSVLFSLQIIENPVESIEVIGELEPLIENADGYQSGEKFIYYYPNNFEDLQVKINYKGGTHKIVDINSTVDGYYISTGDSQWDEPWTLGGNNYITLSYIGVSVEVPVTIIETPVDHIEVITPPTRKYILGDETFGWSEGDSGYWLYPSDLTGLSFRVHYKNGGNKLYDNAAIMDSLIDDIYDGSYELDGHCLSYSTFEGIESAGEYAVTLKYMGCQVDYNITVIESNVASVQVIQNPNGMQYDDRYYADLNGMKVKITYKDSSHRIVTISDSNMEMTFWGSTYVTVDDDLMVIDRGYDEETEKTIYRISYRGVPCNYDTIEFYEGKAVKNISASALPIDGSDIILYVTYEDDSEERLVLDPVVYDSYDDEDYRWCEGIAKTERGYLRYWIESYEEAGEIEHWVYVLEDAWKIDLVAEEDAVYRIYGSDRFKTAFETADALKAELGVEKFDNIIIANGLNFADALAGSYLAAVKKAPILMTAGQNVSDLVAYISTNLNDGGTIYLLGGTSAVPQNVENALTTYNVKRLWGATRFETNLEILTEAGVANQDILVCTAYGFADSLSASATGKPILLVSGALTAEQIEFLASVQGSDFYIIGGVNAVSTDVENTLKTYGDVERLGGADRFETSVMIAEKFFANPESAVIAYSHNFPDGLSGGPLAFSKNGPLILTIAGKEAVAGAYLEQKGITSGAVLGGTGILSDATVKQIFGLGSTDSVRVW